MSLLSRATAGALAVAMLLPSTRTQCTPQWVPGDALPVPTGSVLASTIWDPDGAGPLPTVLVVAGSVTGGHALGEKVFTWDGTTFTSLGTLPAAVTAMTVLNGELYVATEGLNGTINRWTGSAWTSIGNITSPFYNPVNAMTVFNGQLVVGGSFSAIGGIPATNLAAWDGTTWSPVGGGVQGYVHALTVYGSTLWVGGALTAAGGIAVGNLALWNGTSWTGGASFNGPVDCFAIRSSTALLSSYVFVGGSFTSYTVSGVTTPANYCARYVPFSGVWSSASAPAPIHAMVVRLVGLSGYELAALSGPNPAFLVSTWSGTSWTQLTTSGALATASANTLNYYQNRYTVGASSDAAALQAYTGSGWTPIVGQGIHGNALCITSLGDEVVIGGSFTDISGVTVNHLARGSAENWSPLGGGLTNTGSVSVQALTTNTAGDVVVGGYFSAAGSTPAQSIARWDGGTWHAYGSGIPGTVMALLMLPDGDLVAGGVFPLAGGVTCNNIARWDGSSWAPLGVGCSGPVYSLALLPGGDVVAAGAFATAGGTQVNNIARWDGSSWHGLGGGSNNPIAATAVAPNGDLFVGGSFTTIGGYTTRLAKWSAGAWSPVISFGLNSANVYALAVHANGDLFVGGQLFSISLGPFGSWSSPLVRIHGSSLSPMTVGGANVYGLATNDDVVAIGDFATAGTVISSGVARFHSPCPASATSYGAACSGLTSPLSLRALEAPWIGGAYRLQASTFGPVGFGVVALGTTPINVPLGNVFGDAGPGCLASLLPTVLDVVLPTNGTVIVGGAVPLDGSLVGVTFDAQVVQFETAPTPRVSTTNALQLTVGQI